MRRLYLQIHLSFVGIVVLFTVLACVAWMIMPERPRERQFFDGVAGVLADVLPEPGAPEHELESALERLSGQLSVQLTVRGDDGALVAAVGDPLPAPEPGRTGSGWRHARGGPPTWLLRLPDGCWLVARPLHHSARRGLMWLAPLGLLGLAIAIGTYPVARRITRRLERLERQVDEFGAGALDARVEVRGNDEVADLARSFNRAAERIQRLVSAQRTSLASASHELRSPLARMRVAIELLAAKERPEIRDQVARDIAELDDLIGEPLMASRLEAIDELESTEEVDLLALLAEEGARTGAEITGEAVRVHGDPRMLRRLVRNLLENARRYGAGTAVEGSVARCGDSGAVLRVRDRGPGVAAAERERIFEPFYRPAGTREGADGGVGLGLALALVRQIARHHGGDAGCEAREGGGTCFEVRLRTS